MRHTCKESDDHAKRYTACKKDSGRLARPGVVKDLWSA